MNKNCDNCQCKPALTKCRKGKFCKTCGEKCHSKYEHEVQFIIHAPHDESRLNRSRVTKSTVLLVKSGSMYPTRRSKIQPQLKKTMPKVQSSIINSYSPLSHKENKTINIQKSYRVQKSRKEITKQFTVDKTQTQNKNEEEIAALKAKIQSQNHLLKLFKSKLQKQRNINKQMRIQYQQKLKFIRNL